MNLRQKCKRLKKENDRLKGNTVVPHFDICRVDIEKICVSRTIPKSDFEMPGVLEWVKSNMANEMSESLLPYIDFYITEPNRHEFVYTVKSELKVAARRD